MFAAWCLMLEAWGLMLDAWCLNTCQTHPQRVPQRGGGRRPPPFVEAAEGRLPLWMGRVGVQASSIKRQASSVKHQAFVLSPINAPRKLKHFWPDRYRLFSGARLFQIWRFWDFRFWNSKYLKNVEFGRFGVVNPVQNRLVSIRTVFRSLQNH